MMAEIGMHLTTWGM